MLNLKMYKEPRYPEEYLESKRISPRSEARYFGIQGFARTFIFMFVGSLFHNIIHMYNSLWLFLTFRPKVRNIPHNIVSPTKHCYGFE